MSSSKIESKLQDEIVNKIGLLLDKPISPKSTKQIMQLINNGASPKQRIFYIIQLKHRGQLMLHMLQTYPYLVAQSITSTFNSLQKNIMKYDAQMIKQLWKLLTKIIYTREASSVDQNQQLIYKVGYEELLKEGLKVTNLQKKNVIFGLIQENVGLFYQLGLKDNLRKVIATYAECFRKFPITVPNYVRVITLIIRLIQQSNSSKEQSKSQQGIQEKESTQQQKGIKLQKLPQISDQYLTQLITQLNNILQSTKQKPLHLLHNQCLIAMEKIVSYRGNQVLKNDFIYSINKTLQIYLYRKGTRDQARKVSLAVEKVNSYLQMANRQKMARQYSQSSVSQKLNKEPVLIQNVIDRTNQFLAKYHVNNIAGNGNNIQESEVFMKNSRFLKRGQGVGGGKAILQIRSGKDKINLNGDMINQGKKKDKYELMLENCLSKCDWERSEQNPYLKDQQQDNGKDVKGNTRQIRQQQQQMTSLNHNTNHYKSKSRQKQATNKPKGNNNFNQSVYSQFYQDLPKPNQINNYQIKNYSQNNDTNDISQSQINQISDLIDLAYSYKFSLN